MRRATTCMAAMGLALVSGDAWADWADDEDDAPTGPRAITATVEADAVMLSIHLVDEPGDLPRIGQELWIRRDYVEVASTSTWKVEDGVETIDGYWFEYVDRGLADGCYQYELTDGSTVYGYTHAEVGAGCPGEPEAEPYDRAVGEGGGCNVSAVRGRELGLGVGMLAVGLGTLIAGRRRKSR